MNEQPDWRGIVKTGGGLSPDTEKLLQKFLKMQIASMYWGMISKIVIFVFVIASAIFSTLTLAPFLQQQSKVFEDLQNILQNLSGSNSQSNTQNYQINDIIKQLNTMPRGQFVVDEEPSIEKE
jgi:hypothetical protein